MIQRILISPDGQEIVVVTDQGIVVADPHEKYAECVPVGHVEPGWQEVYSRG